MAETGLLVWHSGIDQVKTRLQDEVQVVEESALVARTLDAFDPRVLLILQRPLVTKKLASALCHSE